MTQLRQEPRMTLLLQRRTPYAIALCVVAACQGDADAMGDGGNAGSEAAGNAGPDTHDATGSAGMSRDAAGGSAGRQRDVAIVDYSTDARGPDAIDASAADAARPQPMWLTLQQRFHPSGFEPFSRTFFEAGGNGGVEVSRIGEFFVLQRPALTERGLPALVLHGVLDAAQLGQFDGLVEQAAAAIDNDVRGGTVPVYSCNACDSECARESLAAWGPFGHWRVEGAEFLGPMCDLQNANVPVRLTLLAEALRQIASDAQDRQVPADAIDVPPRMRLGIIEPQSAFGEPVSEDEIAAAIDSPLLSVSLAAISAGPRVDGGWWEVSLEGADAVAVWDACNMLMETGTALAGAGPFLVREGDLVFAVACAPDLPHEIHSLAP